MKKVLLSIIMILSVTILCGCNDKKENNELVDVYGSWVVDNDMTQNNLIEAVDMYNLFGSLYRQTGSELVIKEDGTLSYYAGGMTGEGTFTLDDNTMYAHTQSMNDPSFVEDNILKLTEKYIIMPYGVEDVYWVKK